MWMTPGNKLLPTCYRAKFGHSGSNDTSVIMEKNWPLTSRLSLSLKVTGSDTDRYDRYSYYWSVVTMGSISYRLWERRRFWSKIANYSHPVYFTPSPREFSLEFRNDGSNQENLAPSEQWKEFDDMFIRLDTIGLPQCNGRVSGSEWFLNGITARMRSFSAIYGGYVRNHGY